MMRNFDFRCCSKSRFFECHLQIVAKIGAALDARAAASAAEEVAKPEQVAEDIAEVGKYAGIESAKSLGPRATDTGVAESVVVRAFLRIAQNGICFSRFLELFFGFLISGIAVGMILQRQLSVRTLDFLVARGFYNA